MTAFVSCRKPTTSPGACLQHEMNAHTYLTSIHAPHPADAFQLLAGSLKDGLWHVILSPSSQLMASDEVALIHADRLRFPPLTTLSVRATRIFLHGICRPSPLIRLPDVHTRSL